MPQPEILVRDAKPAAEDGKNARYQILLIGPGFRFLSGLSVYTCRLANALAADHHVSVLLLDRLIPTRLYPGASRVGDDLTSLSYDDSVHIAGEIDWYWGAAMTRTARVLRTERPDVIVLQWWTAATLHTYLMLLRLARREGIPVIIEFHEVQDTGEANLALIAAYCRRYLRTLVRGAAGVICHTRHDLLALQDALGSDLLTHKDIRIAPHGPYDHLNTAAHTPSSAGTTPPTRVLFFGLIRPYKGAEDLIFAFDRMSSEQAAAFEIDIVGETWESWTAPAEAISASRHRERIRFINRYVSDTEAAQLFSAADVLVLPYRRASSSGPLQIAMSHGLHVVMYAVDGLVEAVTDYRGAVLVPPGDIEALRDALVTVSGRRGERFVNPHSWDPLVHAVQELAELGRSQ